MSIITRFQITLKYRTSISAISVKKQSKEYVIEARGLPRLSEAGPKPGGKSN
jgi:hypothetical protein